MFTDGNRRKAKRRKISYQMIGENLAVSAAAILSRMDRSSDKTSGCAASQLGEVYNPCLHFVSCGAQEMDEWLKE